MQIYQTLSGIYRDDENEEKEKERAFHVNDAIWRVHILDAKMSGDLEFSLEFIIEKKNRRDFIHRYIVHIWTNHSLKGKVKFRFQWSWKNLIFLHHYSTRVQGGKIVLFRAICILITIGRSCSNRGTTASQLDGSLRHSPHDLGSPLS